MARYKINLSLCLLQYNQEYPTFDELQECYQGLMG